MSDALIPIRWRYGYARVMNPWLLLLWIATMIAVAIMASSDISYWLVIACFLPFWIAVGPVVNLRCHHCGFSVFWREDQRKTFLNPAGLAVPLAITDACSKCGASFFVPREDNPHPEA